MADEKVPARFSVHQLRPGPGIDPDMDVAETTAHMRRTVAALARSKFGRMPADDAALFKQFSFERLGDFGYAVCTARTYAEVRQQFFCTVWPPESDDADSCG